MYIGGQISNALSVAQLGRAGLSRSAPDKERRTCSSCNREFKTHDIEWAHMAKKQKIWLSLERMDGSVAVYAVILAFVVSGFWRDVTLSAYAEGAITILFVSAVMLGPLVVVKWLTIRHSSNEPLQSKPQPSLALSAIGSYSSRFRCVFNSRATVDLWTYVCYPHLEQGMAAPCHSWA